MKLPELPELPDLPTLESAPRDRRATGLPWHWRLRAALSSYLPLLLMAMLALATWWLVKNTPLPTPPREGVALRHEADYTLERFTLQRYAADGRLSVQIVGDLLRHYPDTDTLEIDAVNIRALGADGSVTLATARRALANGDATEVQLLGGAQISRPADARGPSLEFKGEFLHAFLATERVRSHLPVQLRWGENELRAGGFEYDHLSRVAKLEGPMRSRLEPARVRR